ncbi:EH domain-binding protein 1-like [Bacillus rossius redtenbacheri]|uniref:EH domain-binding protein 1-like n=1 Tax=Bacillus rossius redtenbacheri TaxID=93214 RepID=UPI002FDE206C
MTSVWKRLQRVNKHAAKFQFTVSYHQVTLETTSKWKPNKLSLAWTRRSRRVVTQALPWEPTMKDPLKGVVVWAVPENKEVCVTLFKDPRTQEMEDKDWTFVIEDVSPTGKRRQLASANINMKKYASIESSQTYLTLPFKPLTKKIVSAAMECTLSCVFLREGKATDEDMQSMASLMSVNTSDIAPLDDFDDDEDQEESQSSQQVLDLTSQIYMFTSSRSGSDIASTPISVASLSLYQKDEATPVASENRIIVSFDGADSNDPTDSREPSLASPTSDVSTPSAEGNCPRTQESAQDEYRYFGIHSLYWLFSEICFLCHKKNYINTYTVKPRSCGPQFVRTPRSYVQIFEGKKKVKLYKKL